MPLFESYERRIDKINEVLKANGIASLEEAKAICDQKGLDVANIVREIQPICFENA
ncbi:MAG: GGGtGRT protein, partial [Eubacterium sp.]